MVPVVNQDTHVSTIEAAEMLGVKPSTIYTYVSRGILHSTRRPGANSSWFRRSDVEIFARRRSASSREQPHARLMETAISNIDGVSYRYRGLDPAELADSLTFEQVAEFLWTGEIPPASHWSVDTRSTRSSVWDSGSNSEPLTMDRLRVAAATLAASDPFRLSNQAVALVATGRRLISNLVDSLPIVGPPPIDGSIAARLWARLTAVEPDPDCVAALDSLLTIVADHGVSPSAYAARVVAAYEADLYGAVQAGLSVVSGARRGGMSSSMELLLSEVERVGDVETVLADLNRTKGVPFLPHPRYARADPRTTQIVDLVASVLPNSHVIDVLSKISQIVDDRSLPAVPVELALAAFAHAFEFRKGGSETVFAIGRSAGWIAHAIEVHSQPVPLSPPYSYVGAGAHPSPEPSGSD